MSPLDCPPPKKELMMNGHRPSPLKINKESHLIQKSSVHHHPTLKQQQQRQGPVIIYTHSPKIIHTKARDFMALVQKLTGLSRSDHEITAVLPSRPTQNNNNNNNKKINNNRHEDHNESSSAITDDQTAVGDVNNVCSSSYVPTSTVSVSAMNLFFTDMPLFTPSSTDFFCSPRPVNTGTLNSPSFLEFMKGLPDY